MFIPLSDEPVDEKDTTVTQNSIITATEPTTSNGSFIGTTTVDAFSSANEGKLDARIKKVTAPCKMLHPETQYNFSAIETKTPAARPPPVVRPEAGNAKALHGPVVKAIGTLRVQVHNDSIKSPIGALAKITCSSVIAPGSTKKHWELHIDAPVVCFSCCAKFVLVCSVDSSIRFIDSTSGTLLLPVLSLSSPVILCAISTNMNIAAVLTKLCELRIWNIEKGKVIHALTCGDIFTKGTATSLFVDEAGIPFITLSDGTSFSYSRDLEAWLKLNSADIMSRTLLSKHIARNFVRNMKVCPLTTAQSFGKGSKSNTFETITESWPHTMELLFLENQVKLCHTLVSVDEIKYWYGALGSKLASHGSEAHIRKLLDDLLNAYMCNENDSDKKMFLEILLNNLKGEPKWQRLYMEYVEQLA